MTCTRLHMMVRWFSVSSQRGHNAFNASYETACLGDQPFFSVRHRDPIVGVTDAVQLGHGDMFYVHKAGTMVLNCTGVAG